MWSASINLAYIAVSALLSNSGGDHAIDHCDPSFYRSSCVRNTLDRVCSRAHVQAFSGVHAGSITGLVLSQPLPDVHMHTHTYRGAECNVRALVSWSSGSPNT